MSTDEVIENPEREALLPVAGYIVLCYFFIIIGGYYIGNFIYQIP